MKALYYVPVVHGEGDFGSLGPSLASALKGLSSPARWERHRAAVEGFWRSVEDYLLALAPRPRKVYQDGLPVGGLAGRRIIAEAARRGSRNYQVALRLLDGGAEPVKTEQAALLALEYAEVARLAQGPAPGAGASGQSAPREDLTVARDRAIAASIAATLQEGEMAVLFLGAAHAVLPLLPPDIRVRAVKERGLVLEYFHQLVAGRDEGRFAALASALAAPVPAPC